MLPTLMPKPPKLIKPYALLAASHNAYSLSGVRLQNLTNRLPQGSDHGWKHSTNRGTTTMQHFSPATGYNGQSGTIN